MESKPESTVNYLLFVACTIDVARQNEEVQDRPPQQQEEAYLGLPIDIYIKMTPKNDQ